MSMRDFLELDLEAEFEHVSGLCDKSHHFELLVYGNLESASYFVHVFSAPDADGQVIKDVLSVRPGTFDKLLNFYGSFLTGYETCRIYAK